MTKRNRISSSTSAKKSVSPAKSVVTGGDQVIQNQDQSLTGLRSYSWKHKAFYKDTVTWMPNRLTDNSTNYIRSTNDPSDAVGFGLIQMRLRSADDRLIDRVEATLAKKSSRACRLDPSRDINDVRNIIERTPQESWYRLGMLSNGALAEVPEDSDLPYLYLDSGERLYTLE